MAEDISIEFELADKFNYTGANGEHKEPEFALFAKDYDKLLTFISQNEVVNYHPSMFQSLVWEESMSIKDTGIRGAYKTIRPSVLINNETTQLDIHADLNVKGGQVKLNTPFPFTLQLNPDKETEKYTIKIPYADAEKPYKKDDFAILIHTNDFHHWMYILEKSVHLFKPKLETWIFDAYNRAFDKYNDRNQLDFLYEQAPVWIIARRDNKAVFDDLKKILEGWVDENRTNEEIAVIKIIRSFATFPYYSDDEDYKDYDVNRNVNYLLDKSINEKVEGVTVFQRLYQKMNDYGGDDNFSAFIQLFYLFWLESKYVEKDYGENSDTSPLILDYKSNKVIGFYNDDMDFTFKWTRIKITKTTTSYMDTGTAFIFDEQVEELLNPHIFQPIHVPEIQQDGEMKFLSNVVPAFYLKAFDDKNAWANLEKAIWLVVDIVTTFTGVGNLLKLRHLTKVVKAYKYAKIAIAGIEVVSGTIGLMLNFVNECDDPDDDSFCNKLRTFLIYVDLATLGVDALASKFIRKSAQDALRYMPNSLKKEYPEIFEELTNVARGAEITLEAKNNIIKALSKHNITPKFLKRSVDLYDVNGNFIFRLDPNELEAYFAIVALTRKELRARIRIVNKKLKNSPKRFRSDSEAAKRFGVKSSKNKFGINFNRTKKYIYKKDSVLKIKLTGSRNKDFERCRKLLSEKTGMSIDEIMQIEAEGYTWHHLDDLNEDLECTMQLVDSDAHSPLHIGACGQFTELTGIKYKT